MYEGKCLINGELKTAKENIEIISPIDNKKCGCVPAMKDSDIIEVFKCAQKAQKDWEKKYSLNERIELLNNFKILLIANSSKLSELMSFEIAKSLKDSAKEIERTIQYIDETIQAIKLMELKALKDNSIENKFGLFKRVAKGVILAISPFNYPVNLSISKIAPALVTGNTVVFKPATQGSLTGTFLADLFYQAKFPKGVINVITGKGRDIGDSLVTNENIDLISFTGSATIGNRIKKLSNGKELVLELGGKDPALVLADADLEKTANEIVGGAFSYSGQRCTAIKRVLVEDTIADKLVVKLLEKVKKLSVGSPLENKDITPVIDMATVDLVKDLIEDVKKHGGKILTNINISKNLISPILVDMVSIKSKLAWIEPFAPILPIIRVKTTDEMIKIANDSIYALQASVFTENINQAFSLADKLDCGTVHINSKTQRGPDLFPFLGIKDSGQGVQGIIDTLKSVTRPKGIVVTY
ncbi:aldehyde dehydrogenase family protein [Spiroplasma endosymbiont of Amphibalanus improvisus]|uniref:aldehyde dehydrogenase family protein n=1 Tax=Spiroplasma endosymbiont of Amphibalanus improvisus TaxID=3066327 RepID=UPI00313B9492